MTTLSLKVPDELAARLDALARRRGLTRSAVIREALGLLLTGRRTRATFEERAGNLAGCLEGPGDLSTTRKRMEGFGR